jgi:hypothetical protein
MVAQMTLDEKVRNCIYVGKELKLNNYSQISPSESAVQQMAAQEIFLPLNA